MFESWSTNARRGWLRFAAGTTLLVAMASGCGIIRHRTAARCEQGLPCYTGYGQKTMQGQTPGITFTGIRLIEQPVPEEVLARAAAATVPVSKQVEVEVKKQFSSVLRGAVVPIFSPGDPTPAGIPIPPAPAPEGAPDVSPIPAVVAGTAAAGQPIPAPQPARLRYFALADDALIADHCRLSRVSMILWSDGRWELFVRAEQNPPVPPEGVPPGTAVVARPQRLQTSHIKRNEFHIVAKGFAAAQAADPSGAPDRVAKAVLLHRAMAPFWVERGQPREMTFEGRLDATQDFDLIKRFEVEFAYR